MKRVVMAAILAVCAAGSAGSEDVLELTLEDCVRIGLDRSVRMANARRDEQIAGSRIRQVRAQVLPELKVRGSYTRLDEVESFDMGQGPIELGKLDNYAASAEASQLLYSGGSVRAALKAAELYRERSRLGTQRAEQELQRDIEVGFYGVLLAESHVEVQRESRDQLRAMVEQAEAKFRNETVSEFELLSARVRLANQEPALIRAQRDLEVARESFRNLLHLEEHQFRLRGELRFVPVAVDYEAWRAEGLKRRPELHEQERLVGLWQQDIRAERGKYLPTLRARATYSGANPSSFFSGESGWDWGWDAGLTLEWDLLDGGLRRGRVLEKKLELEKARDNLRDLERAVELEIRAAYLDLKHAAEAVAATANNVELAEKSMRIARTRYDVGLATYLEYTDANLALSDARLNWSGALRAHLAALAQLRCACGLSADEEPGDESR
ncbi:MAG: outer membrane channel protein [Verrucomicrobia bacterium ADurb.Bin345]|nr:MAG: outer membrane channel protein [Verrucomicrobia bacterium ADurb.Bin345]